MNLIPAKPQIVLLDAGTVSWISKIASGVQKNPRADNDHKHACLSSSSLQYTLRYLKSQRTHYLFVSATSLFSAGSSSSSANASAGGAVAEHSHGPVVGLVDDLLQFACHGGGDGRAFGQAAADRAVPLPTGANTPDPRRNTPPFGYPDNLQSNGCCTFN